MGFIRNTKLSTQFIVITLIALASMAVISGVNAITLKNSLLMERKSLIKSAVEIAYNVVLTEATRAEANGEDIAAAQKKMIAQFYEMSFGDNEYFFAVNEQGVSIVSPTAREVEGKSLFNAKDAKGKFFVRELIKNGKNVDGGFTDYYWKRANSDEPINKISYTKTYEAWGWVIGTGLYLDDINALFFEKLVNSLVILTGSVFVMMPSV